MNGLGVDAAEAVRLAVESPTNAECLSDAEKSRGFAEGRRSHQAGWRGSVGRRCARPPQSRAVASTRRDDGGHGINDKVAVRREVEKYAPVGGDVELELFGRKVASFRQVVTTVLFRCPQYMLVHGSRFCRLMDFGADVPRCSSVCFMRVLPYLLQNIRT